MALYLIDVEKMILFAGGLEHVEEAKEYIKTNGFTIQDVRLVKGIDYIHVVTRDGKRLCQRKNQNISSNQK